MLKVKVITIGKTKEKWLKEALMEYEKRLKSHIRFEWIFTKNNETLFKALENKDFIALDSNGEPLNSLDLSKKVFHLFEIFHSEIIFVIGGSEGIPENILRLSKKVLSLSNLTYTHQITRLILIEQIYRAYQIEHGKKYHK